MGRLSKAESKKLKEWAKSLFLKENLTIAEISKKVGVSEKTLRGWLKDGGWENLKAATVISKPEQLAMIYAQINELNTAIKNKAEGERYASTQEADALKKLTASAKDLEGDLGLSEIINVSIPLLEFVKKIDYNTSQLLKQYFDEFIRSIING